MHKTVTPTTRLKNSSAILYPKASIIDTLFIENNIFMNTYFNLPEFYTVELIANISSLCIN